MFFRIKFKKTVLLYIYIYNVKCTQIANILVVFLGPNETSGLGTRLLRETQTALVPRPLPQLGVIKVINVWRRSGEPSSLAFSFVFLCSWFGCNHRLPCLCCGPVSLGDPPKVKRL